MAKQERQFLTAITVVAGLITLIDENGQIAIYRQRGIQKYSEGQIKVLMNAGLLDPRWRMYKELPKHISIFFEDPEVMGKAQATYPSPDKIAKHLSALAEIKGKKKDADIKKETTKAKK